MKDNRFLLLNKISGSPPSIGLIVYDYTAKAQVLSELYFNFVRADSSMTIVVKASLQQPLFTSSQSMLLLTMSDGTTNKNYVAIFQDVPSTTSTYIYQIAASSLFNVRIQSGTFAGTSPLIQFLYSSSSSSDPSILALVKMPTVSTGTLTATLSWSTGAMTDVSAVKSSTTDNTKWFGAYVSLNPSTSAEELYMIRGQIDSGFAMTQMYLYANINLKKVFIDEKADPDYVVSGLSYTSSDQYAKLVILIVQMALGRYAVQGIYTSSLTSSNPLPQIYGRYRDAEYFMAFSSEKIQTLTQPNRIFILPFEEGQIFGSPFFQVSTTNSGVENLDRLLGKINSESMASGGPFVSSTVSSNNVDTEPSSNFIADVSGPATSVNFISSGYFLLTANSTTGQIITMTFDSSTILQTMDFVLSLEDEFGTSIQISSVCFGNETALPGDTIAFTAGTQTLSFGITRGLLAHWAGVFTLNVKASFSSVEYVTAKIQIVIDVPNLFNIQSVDYPFDSSVACNPTLSPYFFGDNNALYDIKGRFLYVGEKSVFLLVGESDGPPFHDGTTTVKAGFFGLFNQTGQPFWIYRLQEDVPAASAQQSSCYYATIANDYAYIICNVRNLASRTLEYTNALIKVKTANGQFQYMRYIWAPTADNSQEVFYFQQLGTSATFILGVQKIDSSNDTFGLMKINDGASFGIDWHYSYQAQSGVVTNIQASYRPASGSYPEAHIISTQKTMAIYPILEVQNNGDISSGIQVVANMASALPCYGTVSPDSQSFLACQIIPRKNFQGLELINLLKIKMNSNDAFRPDTSKQLAYFVTYHVGNGNYVTVTSGQIVSFPGSSGSQVIFYGESENTMLILIIDLATWQEVSTKVIPYGVQGSIDWSEYWGLIRVSGNWQSEYRNYMGFFGKQTYGAKTSTMILSGFDYCYYLQDCTISTPTAQSSPTTIQLLQPAVTPTQSTNIASETLAGFQIAYSYRITSQTFSVEEADRYNWGQGQMRKFFPSSSEYSTKKCGGYDYFPEQFQEFTYIDVEDTTTTNVLIKLITTCSNRPLDLYVYSPQDTMSNNVIIQDFVTFTPSTSMLTIAPDSFQVGQSFNINITFVDRFDGRIVASQSVEIRYNLANKVDFPASEYSECSANIFPFSYGTECRKGLACSFVNYGHYYDDATNSLLMYGSAQSGFRLLKKIDKGSLTDAVVYRVNAYGTLIWMNQIRISDTQDEYAAAATIYNDTYAIVAVLSKYDNIANFMNAKLSFVRFHYDTGKHNGTLYFRDYRALNIKVPIVEVGQLVTFQQGSGSTKQWKILLTGLAQLNTVQRMSMITGFSPYGSVQSYFTTCFQSPVTNDASGTCTTLADLGFCAQILDNYYGQYIAIIKLQMTQSTPENILPPTSSYRRIMISQGNYQTTKTMRPPQFIDPENPTDNLIVIGFFDRKMKICEVIQSSFALANEYDLTFSSSFNMIDNFIMIRVAATNQYAMLISWRDDGTGENSDGLQIVIMDSDFNYVKAQKTIYPFSKAPIYFASKRLSRDQGLYYSYSMNNFAFDNPSPDGQETILGLINFKQGASALDLNECISYVDVNLAALYSIVKVGSPQSVGAETSYTYSQSLLSEAYTTLVWQMQAQNSRQLKPKRMTSSSRTETLKPECQTSDIDAISKPLARNLDPIQVTALSGIVPTIDSSSLGQSSLLTCQGLSQTYLFDTSTFRDPEFPQDDIYSEFSATQLIIDMSQEYAEPGIRMVGVEQCLEDSPTECVTQVQPIQILPPVNYVNPTDISYTCELENEYPKFIGDQYNDVYLNDQVYDEQNSTILLCGRKDFSLFEDGNYQIDAANGFIIYMSTSGEINWAFSAQLISSDRRRTYFQKCKIGKDSTGLSYTLSALFSVQTYEVTLVRQRIEDGVYVFAQKLPNSYGSWFNNEIYINQDNDDFYLITEEETEQIASIRQQHIIWRFDQKPSGLEFRWKHFLQTEITADTYHVSSIILFNRLISYVAPLHDGSNYFMTMQSLNPVDGSHQPSLAKFYASRRFDYSQTLLSDSSKLYLVSSKMQSNNYAREIREYDLTRSPRQAATIITNVKVSSIQSDTVLTTNFLIDLISYSYSQLIITLINRSDLSVSLQKKIETTDLYFYSSATTVQLASDQAASNIFVSFTSFEIMSDEFITGVIIKLDSTLSPPNKCMDFENYPGTSTELGSGEEPFASLSDLTFGTEIGRIQLQPINNLYMESKMQYSDIMFNQPLFYECKPYGISFLPDQQTIQSSVGSVISHSFEKPNLCSGDVVSIDLTVDRLLEVPMWIDADFSDPDIISLTINPDDSSQVGFYELRFTYTLSSISAVRVILLLVYNTSPPIETYEPAAVLCDGVLPLFHLNKNLPVMFTSADIADDFSQFAVCGHKSVFQSVAFLQLYDSNQMLIIEQDLLASQYDSFSVDCKYYEGDYIFQVVNQYTNSQRTEMGLTIFQHNFTGELNNAKELSKDGYVIQADGFQLYYEKLIVYGRQKGFLLSNQVLQPFYLKLNQKLEVLSFKTIIISQGAMIKDLKLSPDEETVFSILGIQDDQNSQNKIWAIVSLYEPTFSQYWATQLRDDSKISAPDYSDYDGPSIDTYAGSLFACAYYIYSYSGIQREAAIVQFDQGTGSYIQSTELKSDTADIVSCSITTAQLEEDVSSMLFVQISLMETTYVVILNAYEDGSQMTIAQPYTSTKLVLYLSLGSVRSILHRFKYDETNQVTHFFSSVYRTDLKGEKIGSQFKTQFYYDDPSDDFIWEKPCSTSQLWGYLDSVTAFLSFNPGDGVERLSQQDYWGELQFDSKMIPLALIDNYFYKNPSNLVSQTLFANSPDFIDYRSSFYDGTSSCSPFAAPVATNLPSGGAYSPLVVRMQPHEINLPTFTQCQNLELTYTLKFSSDADLSLPFEYDQISQKLIVSAYENSQAGRERLVLRASVVKDPSVYTEFPFNIVIRPNTLPSFSVASTTETMAEGTTKDIVITLGADTENDPISVYVSLKDSSGTLVNEIDWFNVKILSSTQIKVKIFKPYLETGDTGVYSIEASAWDQFHVSDQASITIDLTITNANRAPTLTSESLIYLGSYTIGSAVSYSIPMTNYNDADGDSLTQSCVQQGGTPYFNVQKAAGSSYTYTITLLNTPDSNDNAGLHIIACTVNDGTATTTFNYKLRALFNQPVDSTGGTITDYEIELYDTASSYRFSTAQFTGRCSDPEGDTLIEKIYYDEKSIDDATNPLYGILTFNKGTRRVAITPAIRTLNKVFTYQLWYTCSDYYNPDNTVDSSFRIIVFNSNMSPTSSGAHPLVTMFYKDSSKVLTVDTTKFSDDGALTYSLVGTLNSDPIMDNGNQITVTAVDTTHFRLSGFFAHTNENAQSGVVVVGYVKATDIKGQASFSRFEIMKLSCAASCLTCSGPLVTNCLTCDKASPLFLRSDNSCGSCPAGQYGASNGVCASCDPQCTTCTSGGKSATTDSCKCKNLLSITDMVCVSSCGAGQTQSGTSCIINKQPFFTSVFPSAISTQASQNSVWWFRAFDDEGDTIQVSFTVQNQASADVTASTGITILKDTTTNAPFNYKIQFTSSSFTNTVVAMDSTVTYTLKIKIQDTISGASPNEVSMQLVVAGDVSMPPYLNTGVSLIIDPFYIGQSFQKDILKSFFTAPTGKSISLSCINLAPLSAIDNTWISITSITNGLRVSGTTAGLTNAHVGIYFIQCKPDDGVVRPVPLNTYSWILQVNPSYQVSAAPLNPSNIYQYRDSIQTYDLSSVCTDSGNSQINKVLLLNSTSVLQAAFVPFLNWNAATAVLQYKLQSNDYAGTQMFSLVCSNNQASTASTNFTIFALPNYPPAVLKPISNYQVKFTDTSLVVDLSGVFSDPEGQPLVTQLYSSGKAAMPSFITAYSEGTLSLSATFGDAKAYSLEIIARDNITQESVAVPFTLTIQGCHSTCKTCSGVLATQCQTCYPNNRLFESQCFSSCPDGTYLDSSNICLSCPTGCATCNPPNQGVDQCTSCKIGFFLSGTSCPNICPIDQFGNVTTRTCQSIQTQPIPKASKEEYQACKDFVDLFTQQTDTQGVVPYENMVGTTVECANMYQCSDLSTGQSKCQWTRKFAMQCSYSEQTGNVIIRVATNSMPDHCMDTSLAFPKENLMDFQVRFNTPPASSNRANASSSAVALAYQCSSSWVQDTKMPDLYEFTLFSGSSAKVVGIALNGVPLFQGTSELYFDAFRPKAYGLYRYNQSIPVDACLGHAQKDSFYHYYSVSPCIVQSSFKQNAVSKLCQDIPACNSSISSYMTDFANIQTFKTQMVMGIAKDGHKILGPFKKDGNLWQPCDVDFCNGLQLQGEYVYVMTLFHPYTLNCWGPSVTDNIYRAQCSYNSFICGDEFASTASTQFTSYLAVIITTLVALTMLF